MAKWQHQVSLNLDTFPDDVSLVSSILKALETIPGDLIDCEFEDIVEDFKDLKVEAGRGCMDSDEFDGILQCLHEWGDSDHRLWVETITFSNGMSWWAGRG